MISNYGSSPFWFHWWSVLLLINFFRARRCISSQPWINQVSHFAGFEWSEIAMRRRGTCIRYGSRFINALCFPFFNDDIYRPSLIPMKTGTLLIKQIPILISERIESNFTNGLSAAFRLGESMKHEQPRSAAHLGSGDYLHKITSIPSTSSDL